MRFFLVLFLLSGCSKTLDSRLLTAADIIDSCGRSGHRVIHVECARRAQQCKARGVNEQNRCPQWLECDAVRGEWELAIQTAERNLINLQRMIRAIGELRRGK